MKKGIFSFALTLLLFCSVSGFAALAPTSLFNIQMVKFYQKGEISKLEILLDESGAKASRFHITEDKQIVLDIKDAKAGPKVLRGMDTSEFSGAIVYVNVYKKPGTKNDIRVTIQLRDNVRSILETQRNKLILSVENRFGVFGQQQMKEANETTLENNGESLSVVNVPKTDSVEDILTNLTQSGPKKYVGKKISLNVNNLPVGDILKMIAETSGFNIIVDKQVLESAPLTLSLINIPWDQILDTVMNLSKLVAKKNANILMITTLDKAAKEKKKEIEIAAMNIKQEPLVTKIFPLSFAKIGDITKILEDYSTFEQGKISVDERTNMIIVKDTVEVIDRMKKIIATLDTETPQILIEAKIIEASEGYSKNIGLANGLRFGYDPIVSTNNQTPTGPGFTFSSVSGFGGDDGFSGSTFLGLQVGLFKRLTNLDLQLQLMETESRGKVISSPKVITQNKQAATLTSTETTSFLVTRTGSDGSQTVSYEQVSADVSLNVTPQVTNDGSVMMQIAIAKASFGDRPTTSAPPNTTNRNISTNVLVDNGSTVVIGGLYSTEKSETVTGVPFLKDIPLIGWLFRTPYSPTEKKSELIIFLTPRIINQEEAGLVDREGPIS